MSEVKKIATRDSYGAALVELAKDHPDVVVLDADLAADKNLYDLPPEEAKEIPQVCGSLKEALEELDKGRAFLTKGGVFSDDFIDAYIALKSEEEIKVRTFVHPLEYELYYSC